MKALAGALASLMILALGDSARAKTPNICTLVRSPQFRSILEFRYENDVCGWPFPRPCVRFSYYVPKYFIEVVGNAKKTFFDALPGVQVQNSLIKSEPPMGVDDDMGAYSSHAHVIRVPFASLALSGLPCGGALQDLFCFTAMSEHLGSSWKSGLPDMWHPHYLAWSTAPKACLLKGAATSTVGNIIGSAGIDSSTCSWTRSWMSRYPPSTYPVCTGWGIHFPRTGTVTSSDSTTASLMIASRIKSLATEVFQGFQGPADEKWQMVYPQLSAGFREGQNTALLRVKAVSEFGRLRGRPNDFLYSVNQKVSCKQDMPWVVSSEIWLNAIKFACEGME